MRRQTLQRREELRRLHRAPRIDLARRMHGEVRQVGSHRQQAAHRDRRLLRCGPAFHAIEDVEARISAELNARYEGTEQEILVEGKRDNRWHGRTRSNKLVHFVGEAAVGEVVKVRIDRATAWSLQGTTADDALPLAL